MNTGVQRITRGLFRNLQAEFALTPLVWEPRQQNYCELSRRERDFLEKPFAGPRARKGQAVPGRLAYPIPLFSKLRHQLLNRDRAQLNTPAGADEIVFVPEIFCDDRIDWLKNRTQARRVAVFHDAISWRRPDLTPPGRRERFTDYMLALARFDEVVVASNEAANDLREFWKEAGWESMPSVYVNPWPVDDCLTAPLTEPISSGKPNVLCVGTFEARKNHLALLEAAEKIWREQGPVFDLTLIGRTTRFFGNRVITRLRNLRRAGCPVRWDRHVADEQLIAAYDSCVFTVFPSLIEGFGLPIIESLRRGRPCICGGNGALGERVRDGGCLIVDQTNSDNLAHAMLILLTDHALYSRLVRAARSRQFHTWKDFIARMRSLFSSEPALVCA